MLSICSAFRGDESPAAGAEKDEQRPGEGQRRSGAAGETVGRGEYFTEVCVTFVAVCIGS